MATTSLGRLTLDLAVRLSEFSEGLSRAERETQERTRQMGESVSNFRQRLVDELGGTQIGGVIDSLNERLGALRGGGLAVGGALAGMAVGGVAVAAGALTALALETAKADVELQIMANTANTGLKSFQVLTYAAAGLGIEQEALASILADTQEKLGEFSATGGGGAADFFEALQNNTSMTDEEIRNLGKTLQGKDGVEAIQILKDKMEELGATSQEQRFMFESLAGDLGNLMPLFANGGDILNKYGEELEAAGVIKTEEAIEQSRRLTAQTQAVSTQFEGFKTQLAVQMMPVLNNLMEYFVDGKTKGGEFGSVMDSVGLIAKTVGAGIIGVAGGIKLLVMMVQAFGEQVANVGITTSNFFEADGFMAKARALKQGAVDVYNINARLGADFVSEMVTIKNAMTGMYTPATAALTGLAGANYELSKSMDANSKGLAVNTVEADENAKAEEKLAKAKDKTSKSISNQMMVYKAFRSAGLSDNQARIITAEVGRENDYQSKYLFGGHSDPKNNKYNLGMISWQKERGEALHKYLKNLGLIQNGQIVKTQEALNAQAMFALKEITTNPRFDRTKKEFLSNPDVDYNKGTEVLGNNYIAWRYNDSKYASHHGRRDKHYNKLNAELGSDSTMKLLQAENKAIEDAQRAQLSIAAKWANEKEKIELNYQNNVAEIKETYAEGSADYIKYMARAEEDYTRAKNSGMLALSEKYVSEEQRIHADHKKAMKVIEEAYIEDDKLRQYFIDRQNAMYQEDLDNFKFATQAKARAQDKMYQSIADSARAGGINALSTGKDSMMQRTLSDEDYQQWRLNQDYVEGFDSINDDYKSREGEINERDERTKDYLLPELERNELLELARQEHLDKMWALEQEHALRDKTLAEQQAAQRVAIYQSLFAGMTEAAAVFFGESSRMHKAAFALEKGYAVYTALMNVETTRSNTFDALSAIPLIGPYIAGPGSIAAAALQVATAANIQGMSAPTVAGIAHGGLDYVPKESTYMLDEGERVLSPKQNKDFTRFMDTAGRQGNITINNNSSAEVSARREPNGAVTIDMVDKMIEKSFRRIGRPNSLESKSIQRHTTARVKR
ncbi:hypothetical protein [Psychrobacter sp.]|uniref:hypothetical protein n=1 Tax=Psychrobacter sp. TaxID=56811 RepID=UPI003F9BD813